VACAEAAHALAGGGADYKWLEPPVSSAKSAATEASSASAAPAAPAAPAQGGGYEAPASAPAAAAGGRPVAGAGVGVEGGGGGSTPTGGWWWLGVPDERLEPTVAGALPDALADAHGRTVVHLLWAIGALVGAGLLAKVVGTIDPYTSLY